MAKALETYFSELTPLQKAALKRINEFRSELKKHGIHVRSAIELEFMTTDKDGNPLPSKINLRHVHIDLEKAIHPYGPYLEAVGYESIGQPGFLGRSMPTVPSQYEINIADPFLTSVSYRTTQLNPGAVAGITGYIKEQRLNDVLRANSLLTPPPGATPDIEANFAARPYLGKPFRSSSGEDYDQLTSALQVNVSLYDANNHNLFAQSTDLRDHCARSLMELQQELLLPNFPQPVSLHRIHANNCSPNGIGLTRGDNMNWKAKDNHGHKAISVRIIEEPRKSIKPAHGNVLNMTRIENRLPGADADPYVVMAVTMAALVDAVRKHLKKPVVSESIQHLPELHVTPTTVPDDIQRHVSVEPDVGTAHARIIDAYKRSMHGRELLGEELYNAILKEYGSQQAVAKAT